MARLLGIEAIVFVVVIALAGAAGALFVRSSLRPLRRVAGTASRVADQPLGAGIVTLPERVTDVDPRSEAEQVAAALNLLLDHVEASFAQRQATEDRLRRFVADASHELRTPVTVIGGYAQLAQRYPEPLPEPISQALERIGAQVSRMGHSSTTCCCWPAWTPGVRWPSAICVMAGWDQQVSGTAVHPDRLVHVEFIWGTAITLDLRGIEGRTDDALAAVARCRRGSSRSMSGSRPSGRSPR